MVENLSKSVVLTGVQSSNIPHIGNYIGAIRPALELAKQAKESYLFIADYHALNSVHNGKDLNELVEQTAAIWLGAGLDPSRTVIYRQSDIPEIFELNWILSVFTPKGLMNRAHAYKAKVQDNQNAGKEDLDFGVNMGLYCYPILMSADILAYNADLVPVGADNLQHLEIARDIAEKFNRTYEPVFRLPKPLVQTTELLPGLDGRKMSKSYGNHIPLFTDEKQLRKLVMKIVTDSAPPEQPKDPATSHIFQIYKHFATPAQIEDLRKRYEAGIGWGHAKEALFEVLREHFGHLKPKYDHYISDRKEIHSILKDGGAGARIKAAEILKEVRRCIGSSNI